MKLSTMMFLAMLGIAPAIIPQAHAQVEERGINAPLNTIPQVTDTFQDRNTDLRTVSNIHNLSGRIIRVKEVDTNLESTTGMFVLIQANQGRRVLVDIGTLPNDIASQLREGDPINVTGDFRRIDGRLVFQADTAVTGGRTITVARGVDARVPDSTQNDSVVTRGTQGLLPSYMEDMWKGEYPESDTRSVSPLIENETIHGKVIQQRFATDPTKGVEKRMLLLQTDTGRRIVVDLGPTEQAANIDVGIGDSVMVNGSAARYGGRTIFMANSISMADRTYDIDRQLPPDINRQKPANQISGEITRMREVEIRSTEPDTRALGSIVGRDLVVMLKADDGGIIKADLGPVQNINQLNLSRGDRISVEGDQVRQTDGLVLMANKIVIGDRTLTIDRSLP